MIYQALYIILNFQWATYIFDLKKECMGLSIFEAWNKSIFSFNGIQKIIRLVS